MLTRCCFYFHLKTGCTVISISCAVIYGFSALIMTLFLCKLLPETLLNEYFTSQVQLRVLIGSIILLLGAASLIYGTYQEIPFFRNPLASCRWYSYSDNAAHILSDCFSSRTSTHNSRYDCYFGALGIEIFIMIFRRCCFCLPLRRASMTIGTIFMSFFFIEMAIHGQQCFFISAKGKSWDIVQAIILASGIIASILLIYGSLKENRCLVLVWVVVFLIIFISYVILVVLDVLFYETRTIILIIQGCILAIMLYSLMVVHSYYNVLREASTDAVQI